MIRIAILIGAVFLPLIRAQSQPACVQDACCCGVPAEIGVPCGDFEAPPFANPIIVVFAGQSHCDWQVLSGSVDILGPNYLNWANGNPNGPSQFIDLHGNTPGSMATTLTGMTAGYTYTLTLWYAKNAGAASANCQVQIAGGAWLDETFTASNNGADGWLERCFTFTAQSATAELRFTGSGGVTAGGVLLDDISLWGCPPDEEDPVVNNMPPPLVTSPCPGPPPPPDPLAVTDNCPGNIDIQYQETSIPQSCYYDVQRTWVVTDGCGNSIELSQIVQIRDTEDPHFFAPPQDLVVDCGSDALNEFYSWIQNNGNGIAMDDCDPDVTWQAEFIQEPDPGACGTTTVTFTVADECGNTQSATANFTVADFSPPQILLPAEDITVYCPANPMDSMLVWLGLQGGAFAVDECNPLVWSHDFSGGIDDPVIPVTFTVTDACGNTSGTVADFVQILANDTLRLDTFTCDPAMAGADTSIVQVQGCLSVTIQTVTLRPSDTLTTTVSVCDPAMAGSDTLFLQNTGGCDSLVISHRVLQPSDTLTLMVSTCDPSEAGTDTLFFQNQYGCDSIRITETVYSGQYIQRDSALVCGPGQDFTDTLVVTGGPCDSLFITHYTYVLPDTTFLFDSTCDPTLSGVTTEWLSGWQGCDSLIIRSVSLLASDTTFVTGKVCDLTEAMHDTLYLLNQAGCDSVVYIDIAWVGVDTIWQQAWSCDSTQVGSSITISPGPFCDTVIVTATFWSPFSLTQEVLTSCDSTGPAADTLFLTGSAGCDSLHVRMYQYSGLALDALVGDETCPGLSDGNLTAIATAGAGEYVYRLGTGAWQDNPAFAGLASGLYALTVRDAQGCERTLTGIVVSEGLAVAVDAGPDREGDPGALLNATATTFPPGLDVQWAATDPLSCTACLSTQLGPLTTSQTVLVTASSPQGCTASTSFRITVRELNRPAVFIPNSFSPDNDGINDFFSVYGNDQVTGLRSLSIYDRWGNALYSEQALPVNDPGRGWDGTYRGMKVDPGVYIYVAEVELADGRVRLYRGDITVVSKGR